MKKQYMRKKKNETTVLVKLYAFNPNQKEINQYIKEETMLKNKQELHDRYVNHTY